MEISDVRVRIVETNPGDRLKAVCTVTMDDTFVVRDVKVVEGTHGPFVAMPSRKLSVPCPKCRTQNHLRAKYCNECGKQLPAPRIPSDDDGREKVHRDIAHPITAAFRQIIQESVLGAYDEERGDDADEELMEDAVEDGGEDDATDEESDETDVDAKVETDADEETEEQDDDREEEDVNGNVSEYDAIIADLRGDRTRFVKDRDAKARDKSEKKDDSADQSRRRGRRRGRPDRDKPARSESTPPAREPRRSPPPSEEQPREPEIRKPAPVEAVAPRDREDPVIEEDSFAVGLVGSSPSKPNHASRPPIEKPEPVAAEPVEPEPEAQDDSDANEDTGFGAGIL